MKLKQGMYSIALLTGVALMSAQAAFAGVTAKYKITGGHQERVMYQVIRYADKNHVRVDIYDGNKLQGTAIRIGEKVYGIRDGQVIDMTGGMGSMLSRLGIHMPASKPVAPPRFEYTGRTERISGIKGKVYREIENGKSTEVVLVRNKNLFDAWMGSIKLMQKTSFGFSGNRTMPRIRPDSSIAGMAPLRIGHDMELISIKTGRISQSVLALPRGAKPQSISQMMGG